MSFNTVLFTDSGRALQAKAIAGATLNFTKIAMGSGSLGGQSQITLQSLIEPKVELDITEIIRDASYATVKGVFNNADISTGFYWREVGIFAQDPDLGEILYCYGNAGALAEYIPPQSSEIIEKVVALTVIVGNSSTVTATINQSLVYVTIGDLNNLQNDMSIFQTAGGTATDIVLNGIEMQNGRSKSFIVSANNNSGATTINGKPLYKPGTTTAPKLVAGRAVTVWYDTGSGGRFFIKASATGNLTADRALAGYTFSNDDDTDVVGTIQSITPTENDVYETTNTSASAGKLHFLVDSGRYLNGVSWIRKSDPDFHPLNFLDSVNVFGMQGGISDKSGAHRAAVNVDGNTIGRLYMLPEKGYYDGVYSLYFDDPDFHPLNFLSTVNMFGMQGSIPVKTNVGGGIISPSAVGIEGQIYLEVPYGFYDGGGNSSVKYEDPDFIPANIKAGVNMFGLVGTFAVGKKFASGTFATGSSTQIFNYLNDNQASLGSIVVTGLTFKPSIIYATGYVGSTEYSITYLQNYGAVPDEVRMSLYHMNTGNINTVNQTFKGQYGPAYVNSSGFCIPAQTYVTYHWYAFE